jgi:two-component system chemotaxis response regulator CheB
MGAKVLIIDDSAYTRQVIKKILEKDRSLQVIGVASDGIDAMAKTLRFQPDIVTLDLEMPEMDGFSFLRWLMKERPTPVIMVSSYGDSKTVFKALELGAVDFIAKPTKRASVELQTIEKDLIRKIKGIKDIRLDILSKNLELLEKEDDFIARKEEKGKIEVEVVAIGSSTGGPAALQILLTRLPSDFPACVLVSQHMPRGFTGPLSERLNRLSEVYIKEAEEGDSVKPGTVLICPGGYHMSVKRSERRVSITLDEGRLTDKYIPSVDTMMTSVASNYGSNSMGVILTGMGNDGKEGMVEIKRKGGYTIAESKESAVVFGMPAEAIKAKAADTILPLVEIPAEIMRVIDYRVFQKRD